MKLRCQVLKQLHGLLAADKLEDSVKTETELINGDFVDFCDFVIRAFEYLGYKDASDGSLEMFEKAEANQKWVARIR